MRSLARLLAILGLALGLVPTSDGAPWAPGEIDTVEPESVLEAEAAGDSLDDGDGADDVDAAGESARVLPVHVERSSRSAAPDSRPERAVARGRAARGPPTLPR